MPTKEKRELLMRHRRGQLRDLIQAYYRERGWTPKGIPTPATLKGIGLWDFLTEEARRKIALLAG
jgi:aldehyde:ferredoxin oxidoreductase